MIFNAKRNAHSREHFGRTAVFDVLAAGSPRSSSPRVTQINLSIFQSVIFFLVF